MPDEHTSQKIASWAGRIQGMSDDEITALATSNPAILRSIAASALTQARDHEKAATASSAETHTEPADDEASPALDA